LCIAGGTRMMQLSFWNGSLAVGQWIALAVALLLAFWAVYAFNKLVRLRNQMRAAWADIDVQLTRRHDLVPQLVTAVKAYAGHEKAVLETVTELRTRAIQERSPAQLGEVESALEQALTRLLALKEAYPDLKASGNFLELQKELVEIEEHLQYARRFYNGSVRDYNDTVQGVPDLLVARAFAFRSGEFYQADAEQRAAVQVQMQ
jgi:LemA protein